MLALAAPEEPGFVESAMAGEANARYNSGHADAHPSVPRVGGPHPVRPPRRGERRPGEHDAGVRVRRRSRLPLHRDRRAGHRRRGAGRVPRRRPAARLRSAGADQRTAVVAGAPGHGARRGTDPAARGPARRMAGAAGEHRLQERRGGACPRVGAQAQRRTRPGVRRRVQRSSDGPTARRTRRRPVQRTRSSWRRRACASPVRGRCRR